MKFLNLLKSAIYLLIDMIGNETVSKFSDASKNDSDKSLVELDLVPLIARWNDWMFWGLYLYSYRLFIFLIRIT